MKNLQRVVSLVAVAGVAASAAAQTTPPPGMWTVIAHGRTGSCSYPTNYNDLTSATGWMRQLANRIESLSPGNIGIYKLDAATLGLTVLNAGGTTPLDPTKHHVLLFDWAATSDYDSILCASPGGGDRNGYAYAAGEALLAVLQNWNATNKVYGLIGYSRGAAVMSEASRRLMALQSNPAQVVFIDGEGCQTGGTSACNLYSDGRFDAWAPLSGSVRFDNVYETVNERYLAPSLCATDLGGHPRPRCFGLNLGTSYAHTAWSLSSSCPPSYSQPPILQYFISGLQVQAGRYAYPDAMAAVQDPMPPAANSEAIGLPFNGDFAFASLAGWTGTGGGGNGTVATFGGQSTLRLARGQSQTHNYFVVPSCASVIRFNAAMDGGTVGDSALSVVVMSPGVPDQELGPIPVSTLPGAMGLVQERALPTSALGQVARLKFSVTGTAGAAAVHITGVTIPACVACYANCDNSTAAPILNANDFACFLNKYAAGDSYANCDASSTAPVLNALDFGCFLSKFAGGCS